MGVERVTRLSKKIAVVLFVLVAAGAAKPTLAGDAVERLAPAPAPAKLALLANGSLSESIPSSMPENVLRQSRTLLEKKPPEALLRSLILPGWGQRYGERPGRGALFTAVDAGLWLALGYSYQAWHFNEDHYMAYAMQHASIADGQDHDFFVNIGNFNNRDLYNEAQRTDRDYEEQYSGADTWWEWDSTENRYTFKDIRIQADRNKTRISYLVGGLVINRILSAIDASRGLASLQKEVKQKTGISLEYDAQLNGPSLVWRGNLAGK